MNDNNLDAETIRKIPKVSLHDHLDGGLRPATIIELAKAKNMALPEENPEELAKWFVESCSNGNLSDYLKTFEITVAVMQTREELERVAYEFGQDLAADGIIYGEVRWAPEQHTREGLTMAQAIAAVQLGFERACIETNAAGGNLQIGQIICAMRHESRSLEVAELAIAVRETQPANATFGAVVGFDLAGPETGFPADDHTDALELCARNNFPTTIHAGEEGELESLESAIFQRALRLGHGTRLAEDIELIEAVGELVEDAVLHATLGETAQWVRDRQITIESCPTSNLQTKSSPWGETIADHPFDIFYQLGMNVTVNTDNRLMSGVTLTSELALLAETFGYGEEDLRQFQMNAAVAAFLPLEDRDDLLAALQGL